MRSEEPRREALDDMRNQESHKHPLSPGNGGEGGGEGGPSLLTPHSSRAAAPGACRARFADGRWHFQHGPIDLVIGADGEPDAVAAAVERAWQRFQFILEELVGELPLLRAPVQEACAVRGPVARQMVAACWPHREQFVTPMAAVAGAVADEMIGSFHADGVRRAYVNNGGDIALYLTAGQSYRAGLVADPGRWLRGVAPGLDGEVVLAADLPVRGIATSGWRGRSFSLGIADSVTVLAARAAQADAAATMIANAVNVDACTIVRRPACELKDDTDLGERLVTVEVGDLSSREIECALAAGAAHAQRLLDAGTIAAAAMCLRASARVVGGVAARATGGLLEPVVPGAAWTGLLRAGYGHRSRTGSA